MTNNYQDENGFYEDELFKIEDKELIQSKVHRSIGALSSRMMISDNREWGSGVLISKNIVLTAAQRIFNKTQRSKYFQIKFYLNHGTVALHQEVESIKFLPDYRGPLQKEKLVQFDYALIKLKRPVKESLTHAQFLPLSLPCQTCCQELQQNVEIYGFENDGNLKRIQKGLSKSDLLSQIDIKGKKIMYYWMENTNGQIGCPIISHQIIIGIHLGMQILPHIYIGRLVTPDFLEQIKKWCEEIQGDAPIVQKCRHQIRKDKISAAGTLNKQGKENFINLNYDKALACFTQQLKILKQIGKEDSKQAGIAIRWIGNSQYRLKNYQQAVKILRQAILIFDQLGIKDVNYSQSCYWLGMAEKQMGNFDESLQAFRCSLQIGKTSGSQFVISESAKEIVICLTKLNKLKQAKQVIEQYKLEDNL